MVMVVATESKATRTRAVKPDAESPRRSTRPASATRTAAPSETKAGAASWVTVSELPPRSQAETTALHAAENVLAGLGMGVDAKALAKITTGAINFEAVEKAARAGLPFSDLVSSAIDMEALANGVAGLLGKKAPTAEDVRNLQLMITNMFQGASSVIPVGSNRLEQMLGNLRGLNRADRLIATETGRMEAKTSDLPKRIQKALGHLVKAVFPRSKGQELAPHAERSDLFKTIAPIIGNALAAKRAGTPSPASLGSEFLGFLSPSGELVPASVLNN